MGNQNKMKITFLLILFSLFSLITCFEYVIVENSQNNDLVVEQQDEQQPILFGKENSFSQPTILDTYSSLIDVINAAIIRGSEMFNQGRADYCAQLYESTLMELSQVLMIMGEVELSKSVESRAQFSNFLQDFDASWMLRQTLEDLAYTLSLEYNEINEFYQVQNEPQNIVEAKEINCSWGIEIIQINGQLLIQQIQQCDEVFDSNDALFFVRLQVENNVKLDKKVETHHKHHQHRDHHGFHRRHHKKSIVVLIFFVLSMAIICSLAMVVRWHKQVRARRLARNQRQPRVQVVFEHVAPPTTAYPFAHSLQTV